MQKENAKMQDYVGIRLRLESEEEILVRKKNILDDRSIRNDRSREEGLFSIAGIRIRRRDSVWSENREEFLVTDKSDQKLNVMTSGIRNFFNRNRSEFGTVSSRGRRIYVISVKLLQSKRNCRSFVSIR